MQLSGSTKLAQLTVTWLVAVGCVPQVGLEDDGASTGAASSTGPMVTTTSSTTTSPTTVGSSVTDPIETTTTGIGPDESGSSTGVVLPEWCSPIEQDCPRGYKCMPWANDGGSAWNDTKCVPIAEDPSAPGEPCMVEGNGLSGVDDCDGTSMCWDVDLETNIGTCQLFCIGTDEAPTCADPCEICPEFGDGLIKLCFSQCDPLVQNCDPGQACYLIGQYFSCAPDASPDGTGIASPCDLLNACPPGMACRLAMDVPGCPDGRGSCCAPLCPVGGADPCPGLLPGTSCMPVFGEGEGPPEQCQIAPPGVCAQ